MCQQSFLSKTVKIISLVSLSTVALGGVLTNASWAMEEQQDINSNSKKRVLTNASWALEEEGCQSDEDKRSGFKRRLLKEESKEEIQENKNENNIKCFDEKGQPLFNRSSPFIPEETFLNIFRFLPVDNLELMASLSKHWLMMLRNDEFWKAYKGTTRNGFIKKYKETVHIASLAGEFLHEDNHGQLYIRPDQFPLADGQDQFLTSLLHNILYVGLEMGVEKISGGAVADMMEHIGDYCTNVIYKTEAYKEFILNDNGSPEAFNQFKTNNKIKIVTNTEDPKEKIDLISKDIVARIKNKEIDYCYLESMESEEEFEGADSAYFDSFENADVTAYFDALRKRMWGEKSGESMESEEENFEEENFDI